MDQLGLKLLICQMDHTQLLADIQYYFLWDIKKHEKYFNSSEESPILIYPNKIKNKIVFKIKTGYKLQLLTNETMAILGDGSIVDTNKNYKDIAGLEKVFVCLLHYNIAHNDHLQNSKLLYSFVRNNTFGKLLSIEPKELIRTKTTNFIFDYIEIWFVDQDNNLLQTEGKVNISLIIQRGL